MTPPPEPSKDPSSVQSEQSKPPLWSIYQANFDERIPEHLTTAATQIKDTTKDVYNNVKNVALRRRSKTL